MNSPEQRLRFLEDNLRRHVLSLWLDLFGEPAPDFEVEPEWDLNRTFRIAGRRRCIEFRRFRQKRDDDGGRRLTGAFRLRFSRAVSGPIAVGHSSHFGMGLFMPADR